jgi:hypothetical protein
MSKSASASLQTKLTAHHSSAPVIKVISTYLPPDAFVCDEDLAAFVVRGYVYEADCILVKQTKDHKSSRKAVHFIYKP